MDWKKILKYIYGAGDSSHGNVGILPERGKGPSYPPKLQTKMHADINGKEHDMDEYNSGWVMRTSRVRYELRKHVNEDRKQAVSFRRHLRMNENIDNMFDELRKEFPKSTYQELDLIIYDNDGNEYSEDDKFQEKIFRNLFINYEMDVVDIRRNKYSLFDIQTDILIEQEDLAVVGKVISIVVKHLSKIEFEEYTRG
ncbi:hypothetical protein [Ligilactobacillus salivarius]|uniref:hypothetical protein n=1 Tax=Ligilactobacillus salivarius TaxID=1624 RepID=UPI00136A7A06|nr:hypothetical protein [Ligilactobacillus salivarius]